MILALKKSMLCSLFGAFALLTSLDQAFANFADFPEIFTKLSEAKNIREARTITETDFESEEDFDDFLTYLAVARLEDLPKLPWHSFRALIERTGVDRTKSAEMIQLIRRAPARESWNLVILNRLNILMGTGLIGGLYSDSQVAPYIFGGLFLLNSSARSLLKLLVEIPEHRRILREFVSSLHGDCQHFLHVLAESKLPRIRLSGRIDR